MHKRTNKKNLNEKSGIGPGNVSKLLGIHYSHTGLSLLSKEIWLEDRGVEISESKIISGPRVGVDYAGEDARLPYQFILKV